MKKSEIIENLFFTGMDFGLGEDFSMKIIESVICCDPIKVNDSKREIKRKLNKFLENNQDGGLIRPRILFCKTDSISIQASAFHHSIPRTNKAKKYYAVEAGFPSFKFSQNFDELYLEKDAEIYSYLSLNVLCAELCRCANIHKRKNA